MSKKDKNKLRLNSKSKILVLGLILFVLMGFLSPVINVQAQNAILGTCVLTRGQYKNTEEKVCKRYSDFQSWTANQTPTTPPTGATSPSTPTPTPTPAPTTPIVCRYKADGAFGQKKGDPVAGTPLTQTQCGLNSPYYWGTATTETAPPISAYQQCINSGGNYESCKNLSGRPATPPTTPTPAPKANTNYVLLAPLPCDKDTPTPGCIDGKLTTFDPTSSKDNNALGSYLNTMIKIFIGLCAVLAMVMIVMGGIQYMTSELISGKEAGRERLTNAILGLLLALGAYALLFTINPNLLKTDLESLEDVTVEVTLDQANFAKTEKTVTEVGTKYVVSGTPSSGVDNFVRSQLGNKPLRTVVVDTATKRAYFYVGPEGDWSQFVSVPVNLGLNGVAEIGQASVGDLKTPKGTTTIGGDIRVGGNGNAVISNGGYNLGAAFVNIGATAGGSDRGIGFHGSYNNNLSATNGCIRMSNQDLIALAPYMKTGVKIIIK